MRPSVVVLPAPEGPKIKKNSPFQHTLITELANDSIGYIPTVKAYKEGGYEPNTCILSPYAGDQLMKKALKLLKDLKNKINNNAHAKD